MKHKRLKHGEYIRMSDEEKKQWKHFLQKRWRKEHPEKMRESNKKWAQFYNETKPCKCVCKVCGNVFNARRNYLKKCPACVLASHEKQSLLKQQLQERKQKRQDFVVTIVEMYKSGLTQQQIADIMKRSQSNISAILRKNKKILTSKK